MRRVRFTAALLAAATLVLGSEAASAGDDTKKVAVLQLKQRDPTIRKESVDEAFAPPTTALPQKAPAKKRTGLRKLMPIDDFGGY